MDEGRERNEGRPEEPSAGGDAPDRDSQGNDREPSEAPHRTGGFGAGWFGMGRMVVVEGEPRPVASLLRRGAALAIDLCFALLAVAIAIDVLSFQVPIDTDRATGPMFALFGLLLVYIVWLRDRGASRPGGALRFGLSIGRWFLGLRLVPVEGPRRFTRPITVADTLGTEGETMRIVRAVLLGVAASLFALLLLGDAVSRTVVFRTVEDHALRNTPLAAERGSDPVLAGVPSALVVGRTRAYVRVDAEWGERADSLEFFLERGDGAWRVTEVRIGEPSFFRNYALSAPDAEVPTP